MENKTLSETSGNENDGIEDQRKLKNCENCGSTIWFSVIKDADKDLAKWFNSERKSAELKCANCGTPF
jgi:hypothetical protein